MLYGAGGLEGRGRPSKGVPRDEQERRLARGKTRQSQARAGAAPSLRRASWSAIRAKPLWKTAFRKASRTCETLY